MLQMIEDLEEVLGCFVAAAGCRAGVGSAIAKDGATLIAGVTIAGTCLKTIDCLANNPLEN
jgi:hypothetical protein